MSQTLDTPETASKNSAAKSSRPAPEPATTEPGKTKSALERWGKTFNHLLRRTHLYAGLLLLPWVILYGVTGFLFNHAEFMADAKIWHLAQSDFADTPLQNLPAPAQLAEELVAEINARNQGEYRLIKPEAARYERGGLSASVKDGAGKEYTVLIDPQGHGGTVREGAARGAEGRGRGKAPFAVREGMEIKANPAGLIEEGLPDALAKVGINDSTVGEVRMAPLSFQMEGDGKLWQVTFNSQAGSLAGQEVAAGNGPELSARSFLLRLHLAHHYPSEFNFKWIWAVIVDVMSGLMVFWGLSGIIMWWQIKRTRWLGAALLAVSLLAAVWIGMGMHELMQLNPGGR